MTDETTMWVKGASNPQDLASAIAHAVYSGKKVTLRGIGAQSVNQAVKAGAIARGFVAQRGFDLSLIPGFLTVKIDNEDRSAIVLKISVS